MVGIEPTVYALSGRCFTCKLIRICCVAYTVRHPWSVEPFKVVYEYHMEDGTGFEPVIVLQQHFFSKETQ